MGLLDSDYFDGEKVPNFKLAVHLFQIVLAFIIFIMEIVVFHNDDAEINGRNGWTFACVRFTPRRIYQGGHVIRRTWGDSRA